MFSDPWIMAGAGVMIGIITVAFVFRTYNNLKDRAEKSSKKPPA